MPESSSRQILVIGNRKPCYEAALELGCGVLLWCDGPLHESRRKQVQGFLESPFADNAEALTEEVKAFLESHAISRVLAVTEASVVLGARVRAFLGLDSLAVDVVNRFHDKHAMKNSAREAGIPVTDYAMITADDSADDLIAKLGLPVVVKPVSESGAQDVRTCRTAAEVASAMRPGLLAERHVAGSEVSVETFVHRGEPVFHNCTEYLHQWKKSVVPARLEPELKRRVLELNDTVLAHFGVDRGVTHAEFYLTEAGPVFGEVAIRPPGGYYMDLIRRVYGFDPWQAYVRLSCGEDAGPFDDEPRGHAAVLVFHPGSGRIAAVHGEDLIRQRLREIIDFRIRHGPGEVVAEHTRTSNEVARLLFWEPTREALMESIAFAEDTLRFEMESVRSPG